MAVANNFILNFDNDCPVINHNLNMFDEVIATVDKLNYQEIKSIMFLLMYDIKPSIYLSLIGDSKEKLLVFLKRFIKQEYSHKDPKSLLSELLGTIKKYKLLKTLGFCKHNINNYKFCNVKPFWKMLYDICENLNDNELNKLKKKYTVQDSLIYAEDVLCYLHVQGYLRENKECSFNNFLHEIEPKLADRFEDCIDKIKQQDRYYIRDPQPNNPCGLALIINQQVFYNNNENSERHGSEIDKEKLKDLWNNFGFKTEIFENLKAEEIQGLFEELCHRNDIDYDIFVSCILSHGAEGVIYGTDSKPVEIDFLINSVCKCTYLNKKPKLFFIQACQGQHHQGSPPINMDVRCDSIAINLNILRENDYIVKGDIYTAISTIPGFVSYRSPSLGGLFVDKLVEKLKEDGDKEELQLIMTKVKSLTTEGPVQQMPVTSSTLRKHLVFKKMYV